MAVLWKDTRFPSRVLLATSWFGVFVLADGFVSILPALFGSHSSNYDIATSTMVQMEMKWNRIDIESICFGEKSAGDPKIFKDTDYRDAVYKAWQEESKSAGWQGKDFDVQMSSISYHSVVVETTPLYGYVVRPTKTELQTQQSNGLPGIILFHTGAGPHDIFLFWKAQSLIFSEAFPSGCIVLIADILSDGTGWAWNPDRSRFHDVYKSTIALENSTNGERPVLQLRVAAAYDALCAIPDVDASRVSALGWCLGGHPILELGRSRSSRYIGLRSMTTFHGVFGPLHEYLLPPLNNQVDGEEEGLPSTCVGAKPPTTTDNRHVQCRILRCTGKDDPFVDKVDLKACVDVLQQCGHSVEILELDGKHGFSNPAQDFNENPAFEFHASSALVAWEKALELLKGTCA